MFVSHAVSWCLMAFCLCHGYHTNAVSCKAATDCMSVCRSQFDHKVTVESFVGKCVGFESLSCKELCDCYASSVLSKLRLDAPCRHRKEKTTPFVVSLMRSQVLYQAAQSMPTYIMHALLL